MWNLGKAKRVSLFLYKGKDDELRLMENMYETVGALLQCSSLPIYTSL